MEKIKCIVTNQGRELLSKCQSDSKSITFTRLTAGSGVYSEDEDLKEKTSLKEHKQTFSSFYISRENGNVTIIRGILSNEGLEESYKVREIGIWAKEKDSENEILYAISVTLDDEMADLMFVKQSEQYSSIEYNHYLKIDNDVQVTIVPDADNSLARMYMEFDNLKKEYYKLIKKGSLILEDDVEKMRYNDCGFQVKEKDGEKWKSAMVGSGYPPGRMILFEAHGGYDKALLRFILPPDTPVDKVAGVMFRYRTDKNPKNINDGTLGCVYKIPDNKKNDGKEIEVYVENLSPNTQYYFKAFPFTHAGVFDEGEYRNYSETKTLLNPDKEYVNISSNNRYSYYEFELTIDENTEKILTKDFPIEINSGKKYSIKPKARNGVFFSPDKFVDIVAEANKIRYLKCDVSYLRHDCFDSMSWKAIRDIARAGKLRDICKIGSVKRDGNNVWQVIKILDTSYFGGQTLYIRLLKGYKVYDLFTVIEEQMSAEHSEARIYLDPWPVVTGQLKKYSSDAGDLDGNFSIDSRLKTYLGDLTDNKHNRALFDENGKKLNVFKSCSASLHSSSFDSGATIEATYYDVESDTVKSVNYFVEFSHDFSGYASQPIYMNTVFPLIRVIK